MRRRLFTSALASTALAVANDKRIKVGVLTHAEGAHLGAYLEALAVTPEVASVSLADPSGQTEAAARKALGTRLTAVYRDPGELLGKEKPEMALITMEAKLSPPVIAQALDAGAHVLAEKPSCVRLADFQALVRKAESKKRHLLLALANRVDPVVMEAKRLIDSGTTGKIYGAELHIIADQTRLTRPAYHQTWFAKKDRAGGGHLIWLGIHWLDLVSHLTGSRIREVAAFAGNVGGQPIGVEDSAAAVLRFDKGFFSTVTSGYYLDRGYHSMIKIWGADGWLELRKHGSEIPLQWYSNRESKEGVHRYLGPTEPTGYTPFVQRVTRAFAGLEELPLSTGDGMRVLEVVFGAYRAADTKSTISIS
jgi:predicted dehydrogenase